MADVSPTTKWLVDCDKHNGNPPWGNDGATMKNFEEMLSIDPWDLCVPVHHDWVMVRRATQI